MIPHEGWGGGKPLVPVWAARGAGVREGRPGGGGVQGGRGGRGVLAWGGGDGGGQL